jgi:hypothetical protein
MQINVYLNQFSMIPIFALETEVVPDVGDTISVELDGFLGMYTVIARVFILGKSLPFLLVEGGPEYKVDSLVSKGLGDSNGK